VFILLNSKTKAMNVVGAVFEGPGDKERAMDIVREIVKELKADTTISILESYMLEASHPDDYDKAIKQYGSISKHPNAKEVIFISVETRYGTWVAAIDLIKTGGVRVFSNSIEFKKMELQGTLSNLIPLKVVLH
jgi:hypothetical protein